MILGRWSEAITREPGNLLPVMVMRKRIGRGALMCLIDVTVAGWGEGNMERRLR